RHGLPHLLRQRPTGAVVVPPLRLFRHHPRERDRVHPDPALRGRRRNVQRRDRPLGEIGAAAGEDSRGVGGGEGGRGGGGGRGGAPPPSPPREGGGGAPAGWGRAPCHDASICPPPVAGEG